MSSCEIIEGREGVAVLDTSSSFSSLFRDNFLLTQFCISFDECCKYTVPFIHPWDE